MGRNWQSIRITRSSTDCASFIVKGKVNRNKQKVCYDINNNDDRYVYKMFIVGNIVPAIMRLYDKQKAQEGSKDITSQKIWYARLLIHI